MLRRVLPALLLLASLPLAAGEAPPHLAVIDASRAAFSPEQFDRLRLIAEVLLPAAGPGELRVFDRSLRSVPSLAGLERRARISDYGAALEGIAAATPAQGRLLVVLAGDGRPEVVGGEGILEAYLRLARPGATRADINAAVDAELRRRYADAVRQPTLSWLLLSSDAFATPAGAPDQLLAWIARQRPGSPHLSLARTPLAGILAALEQLGYAPHRERELRELRGSGQLAFTLPEGCRGALLVTNARSEGEHALRLAGAPAQPLDEDGVARAWRIDALPDGGALQVVLEAAPLASGPLAVEAALLVTAELTHRMQAQAPAGQRAIFAGDEVAIAHAWQRGDGRPVSEPTAEALRAAVSLAGEGVTVLDGGRIKLPPKAGKAVIEARFAEPWSRRVATSALTLEWGVAEPLVLAGGFMRERAYDGQMVEIRCERRGGRLAELRGELRLQGPGGALRTVALQPVPGQRDQYQASVSFAAEERGEWTIVAFAGNEPAQLIAAPPRTLTLSVVRNWWPWILAALALLLLLAALLAWWWLTRPRLGEAGLLTDDGQFVRLASCPGPGRETSHGCPAFGTDILIRATRQGLRLERVDERATFWVNARHAGAGTILVPGNDLELWQGERRVHARLFASEAEARQGLPPQIDPHSFASELVVIAP